MLRKILSLVFSCEKKRDGKIDQTSGKNSDGGSTESISSMDFVSIKKKTEQYPDPWDDPLM